MSEYIEQKSFICIFGFKYKY